MTHNRMTRWTGVLAACTLLVACGGGGGEDAAAPSPDVPDEALVSPGGYTEWAKGLRIDESAEPLSMGRLDEAPSSETDEPVALE